MRNIFRLLMYEQKLKITKKKRETEQFTNDECHNI